MGPGGRAAVSRCTAERRCTLASENPPPVARLHLPSPACAQRHAATALRRTPPIAATSTRPPQGAPGMYPAGTRQAAPQPFSTGLSTISPDIGILGTMTPVGSSPVFIGRQQELHTLLDHAERARSGDAAATVLIGGDAGVGKSRLVAEFTDHAASRVVAGGCLELGVDGLPFAPFVAVLRQLLRDHGRDAFDALAQSGTRELARLLPELGTPPDDRREARG